jgi:hypothetical protein
VVLTIASGIFNSVSHLTNHFRNKLSVANLQSKTIGCYHRSVQSTKDLRSPTLSSKSCSAALTALEAVIEISLQSGLALAVADMASSGNKNVRVECWVRCAGMAFLSLLRSQGPIPLDLTDFSAHAGQGANRVTVISKYERHGRDVRHSRHAQWPDRVISVFSQFGREANSGALHLSKFILR